MRLDKAGKGKKYLALTIPFILSLLLLLFSICSISPFPSISLTPLAIAKDPFPKPIGYVSDFAGLLSPDLIHHLNGLIAYVKEKTGAEVAVVTIETIGSYSIEDYAVRLFETWGIGEKGKDNGVLLLIARQERKIRIEVGYGLEGAITDGTAGEIIRTIISPAFKKGNFNQGLLAGTETILRLIAKEYNIELPEGLSFRTTTSIKPQTRSLGKGLFSFFFFLFLLILLFRGRLWPLLFLGLFGRDWPQGGGWSGGGGGFGGGFGGFGGGLSGGGGASGGW